MLAISIHSTLFFYLLFSQIKNIIKIGLGCLAVLVVIALAGMYKFNYLASQPGYDVDGNKIDVSQLEHQDPVIYADDTGETIEVAYGKDSAGNQVATVHFITIEDQYLKAFTGFRSQSASGIRYTTKDKRFTFWSKGTEASIFDAQDQLLFSGAELSESE